MFFDIHSHILGGVDDGAKDLDESIELLKDMYSQGITDVIATPHFYPQTDVLEDFITTVNSKFCELENTIKTKNLPNIYLGCEVFYYSGISKASELEKLALNGSNYILLEPSFSLLGKGFQKELLYLRDTLGITPILAHIERYHREKGFKELVTFIKENNILTQVNASSFTNRHYSRTLKKLIKENVISFIATDTHSKDHRPPLLNEAFMIIEKKFGIDYKQKLLKNSEELFKKITGKGN
ncbi:MAG: hypothetical protein IKT44_01190 [Clostridia bacterium]|nr:hypothetical protein [Clostridia bacterium]